MPPSREAFHLRACLKSLVTYFDKRWKIVPVKKCPLPLCMTNRCLLTSIFKMYINFFFFWYIAWMVPRMSNIFEKDPLISWPICYRWKNYLVLRLWVVFWNACLSCLFLFLFQSFTFEGNFLSFHSYWSMKELIFIILCRSVLICLWFIQLLLHTGNSCCH